MRVRLCLHLLALCLCSGIACAQTEAWPARPVRLIVPYGAGNVADLVARLLAEDMSKRWGQRAQPLAPADAQRAGAAEPRR